MVRKNDSIKSIALAMSQQAPVYQRGQGKAIKVPVFKKIIADIMAGYPAHTKLPPVRLLAKSVGISLVTAQRVVTELIDDGVLYSRPRAGVYVADRSYDHPSKVDDSAGSPSFESSFRFGTDSRADFQRPLWTGLLERFGERYPNIHAELSFVTDPTDATRPLDVYERLDWNNVQWSRDQNHLLDLREFAPSEIADRCTDPGVLPLYFRSNYIFYNPELLQGCSIKEPRFRTFTEQLQYLADNAPRLEKGGFDPRPFAVQQPVTSIGSRHLPLFFSLVYEEGEHQTDLALFNAAAENAIRLCRLCRRAPGLNNPLARDQRNRFMAGLEPFFVGHSVDYWEFAQASLSFPINCYPSLCTDDSLFLHPMVGCVNRQSRRPAESIRLLSYLVGPEAQSQFALSGSYPVNLAAKDAPVTTADPAWLAQTLAYSRPMHLSTQDRFYLAVNVLNNELWAALLEHVSVEQAVSQSIHLGRAYLRQHPSEHAIT